MTLETSGSDRPPVLFLPALIALALLGVLSLLLAPMEVLAPPGVDPKLFAWLSLAQPAMLAVIGAVIGFALAPRTGLDAPLLRAVLEGRPVRPVLQRQLMPGLMGGIAAGAVLIAFTHITSGQIHSAFELPLVTRVLYGGITEEIIARWGLMSLGVWLALKVSRNHGAPQRHHYWAGNLFAAALFAAGHLPVLFATADTVSPLVVLTIMAANLLPALVFGHLFQSRGLEAAIIAHAGAHLTAAGFFLAT